MFTTLDSRKEYGEERWIGIGFLRKNIVVVVFTERDNDTIRIISLRKALKHERTQLEKILRNQLDTN